LSAPAAVLGAAPRPRSRAAHDTESVSRSHQVALALAAAGVSTLAWLHPAGPGNSSPTDLLMVPAIVAIAVWVCVSRAVIRAPFGISIGLVIVAGCISGLAGPFLRGALVTVGYPQAPLIAVVQDAYLLIWCLALVNLARSASALRVLLAAWVFASVFWAGLLIVGVESGITALSGIEVGNGVRAEGQFGDPNMAAGYFAISIFILWSSDVPRRVWQRLCFAGVLLFAMVLTGSNGGFLSLAVGVTFVLLAAIRRNHGPIVAVIAACAVLLIGAGATQVVHPTEIQQWARDSGIPILRDWIGRSDSSASQRVVIIKEAWDMFQKAGPLGAGPGATQPILADSLAPFPHQAHDDYLAAVVERGVEGGVALIVLICAIVWRARHAVGGRLKPDFAAVVPRRDALIGALLGVAVAAAYYEVLHFRHVWALLAVLAALQIWGRDWATT
jgi:O-antigen ligase/polysaccharide polymerase Wzy-like membrane protein